MAKEIEELEVCNICGERGIDEEHDLYDCTENWEEQNGIPRGTWLKDWVRNLQKKWKEEKENPKESDFVKWSKQYD